MVPQRHRILARALGAILIGLTGTLPCAGHGGGGGHGGGAGHTLGGFGGFHGAPYGFRGGYGYGRFYGYPGFYGYPFYGLGLGLGLGYGLGYGMGYGGYGMGYGGYGMGYGYGYPYYGYPYYGYGPAYPGYANPGGYGPPPAACPPGYAAAGQTAAPGAPGGAVPGGPIRLTDADALLSIRVPPNAAVRINGVLTTQNGSRREFVSSGLSPGRTYTFVVTAQWMEPSGHAVKLEKRIHVQGGERRNVDFLTPSPPAQDAPPNDAAAD
jgi:uncharacterized protein (TIGR03000 family)